MPLTSRRRRHRQLAANRVVIRRCGISPRYGGLLSRRLPGEDPPDRLEPDAFLARVENDADLTLLRRQAEREATGRTVAEGATRVGPDRKSKRKAPRFSMNGDLVDDRYAATSRPRRERRPRAAHHRVRRPRRLPRPDDRLARQTSPPTPRRDVNENERGGGDERRVDPRTDAATTRGRCSPPVWSCEVVPRSITIREACSR